MLNQGESAQQNPFLTLFLAGLVVAPTTAFAACISSRAFQGQHS